MMNTSAQAVRGDHLWGLGLRVSPGPGPGGTEGGGACRRGLRGRARAGGRASLAPWRLLDRAVQGWRPAPPAGAPPQRMRQPVAHQGGVALGPIHDERVVLGEACVAAEGGGCVGALRQGRQATNPVVAGCRLRRGVGWGGGALARCHRCNDTPMNLMSALSALPAGAAAVAPASA